MGSTHSLACLELPVQNMMQYIFSSLHSFNVGNSYIWDAEACFWRVRRDTTIENIILYLCSRFLCKYLLGDLFPLRTQTKIQPVHNLWMYLFPTNKAWELDDVSSVFFSLEARKLTLHSHGFSNSFSFFFFHVNYLDFNHFFFFFFIFIFLVF